ncbi:hypothetical protein MUK42_36468 [Musa troglodytarum]|uniref:Secreted protein n=1 Tax=Musa troglodytarum TaxID=320322 RepID=A0A9E7EEX1_9LILI|nr:hypothetical protein MUK42_36468 [Musa troglodytarum]
MKFLGPGRCAALAPTWFASLLRLLSVTNQDNEAKLWTKPRFPRLFRFSRAAPSRFLIVEGSADPRVSFLDSSFDSPSPGFVPLDKLRAGAIG